MNNSSIKERVINGNNNNYIERVKPTYNNLELFIENQFNLNHSQSCLSKANKMSVSPAVMITCRVSEPSLLRAAKLYSESPSFIITWYQSEPILLIITYRLSEPICLIITRAFSEPALSIITKYRSESRLLILT